MPGKIGERAIAYNEPILILADDGGQHAIKKSSFDALPVAVNAAI